MSIVDKNQTCTLWVPEALSATPPYAGVNFSYNNSPYLYAYTNDFDYESEIGETYFVLDGVTHIAADNGGFPDPDWPIDSGYRLVSATSEAYPGGVPSYDSDHTWSVRYCSRVRSVYSDVDPFELLSTTYTYATTATKTFRTLKQAPGAPVSTYATPTDIPSFEGITFGWTPGPAPAAEVYDFYVGIEGVGEPELVSENQVGTTYFYSYPIGRSERTQYNYFILSKIFSYGIYLETESAHPGGQWRSLVGCGPIETYDLPDTQTGVSTAIKVISADYPFTEAGD
jgi:hypothetical protein